MGELQRLLDMGNSKLIHEAKKRLEDFCFKVQFYGVWKKVMKPPMTLVILLSLLIYCVAVSTDMGLNRVVYAANM